MQIQTKTSPDHAGSKIAFSWLLLLRWGAMLCQILVILAVYLLFQITLPILILAAVLGFEAVSNLFFHRLNRQNDSAPGWLFAIIMFLDTVLLSMLLYYTGGPMNPFTFLYLIHIVLGAMLMPPFYSWSLAAFTALCYAALFYIFPGRSFDLVSLFKGPVLSHCDLFNPAGAFGQDHMEIHLKGMWVAYAVTAFFVVFLVGKIQKALQSHQKTIQELREERARSEKLASLATLAAGAAHEFSTPLSTIAVAAGEMQYVLQEEKGPADLLSDVRLIREQVNRCREILFQLNADAGEHLGENFKPFRFDAALNEALVLLPDSARSRVLVDNEAADVTLAMPFRTLSRIIRALVNNGLDASPPDSPVSIHCWTDSDFLNIEVVDKGSGMDADTLDRAPEPFFTTKEPGSGMGLGLFLAKTAAERFDGSLNLQSVKGEGTTVVLRLNLARISESNS